jgi:glycine/D-amino acid oxidase-like deaminating enzyme
VADCEAHLEALRQDRLPASAYLGPEGRGLLIPTDAAFNPLERCGQLATQLVPLGIRLHEHTPALRIAPGSVETTRGVIRASHILIASDGGLTTLVPALESRIQTARLQMLATAPERQVRVPRPVYARFGMEYWQQLPGGEIALGGFRDVGGDTEWTSNRTPSVSVQEALERFLREFLGVHSAITHRWAASVGYVEGELPILEETAPGVWAMGGYNGTGNLIGALCGRAAVELALHNRSDIGALLGARRWGEDGQGG